MTEAIKPTVSPMISGAGAGVALVQLTSTESKTEAVKAKIIKLSEVSSGNEKTIADLKLQLMELGIRPNGALHHMGVLVSMEPGELGKSETELFALQKKVSAQNHFISNLQRQLANG